MKIDLFDFRILREIEKNPIESFSKIGKKISRSQQFVNYKINQLINNKVVSLSTSINLFKLGYRNFFLFLKLYDAADLTSTFQKFMNHNSINWVIQTGFEYDFILLISSKSVSDLYKKINDITKEINLSHQVLKEILVQYQLSHTYITKNSKLIKNSAFSTSASIDELDSKILREINTNCRKSSLSIGKKTGVNYKTVINRINSLRKKGVISGCRAYINPEALGYNSYFLLFETASKKKLPSEILTYLRNIKGCTDVFEFLGTYSFACILRVKTGLEVNTVLSNLKKEITEIKLLNAFPVFDDSLFNNFPI
jgi:Lrp/AsnC family leucine-responsive transcriptional regulator